MAKKVAGFIKLQIPAGKATPAPPVGPALGQHGVNIMEFVKQFNEKTAKQVGLVIPAVITVYADRSFVCFEEPAGGRSHQEGMQDRKGIRRSQQNKGCEDHKSAAAGNCRNEEGRPECSVCGSGHEHDRWNSEKHGRGSSRLREELWEAVLPRNHREVFQ